MTNLENKVCCLGEIDWTVFLLKRGPCTPIVPWGLSVLDVRSVGSLDREREKGEEKDSRSRVPLRFRDEGSRGRNQDRGLLWRTGSGQTPDYK